MFIYLQALIAKRKFVLAAALLAALISAFVSLMLPKWFTASTSVFPPEPKSAISPYAQIIQNLQAPLLGPTAIGARPGTIYIDIIKSRSLGEKIIDEFDLKHLYGTPLMEDALDVLHSHTYFSLLENGLLKISFEHPDPEGAAAIANRFVELLDEFTRQYNISRASKTREFIESQLQIHERELRKAEEALKKFQEDYRAVDLDEQTRSAIEIVADLTGRAITLEIELKILRHYAVPTSEEYKRKKLDYDEVVQQLAKFKVDSTRSNSDLVRTFFPALDKVPETSLNFARRLRDVKVGEKVYEMLVKEHEQARIEEARDTPTVQVLDAATPPELRSRPRRKRVVILGTLLGAAWAGLVVILSAAWSERRDKSMIAEMFEPIAGDFRRFFRRRKK